MTTEIGLKYPSSNTIHIGSTINSNVHFFPLSRGVKDQNFKNYQRHERTGSRHHKEA